MAWAVRVASLRCLPELYCSCLVPASAEAFRGWDAGRLPAADCKAAVI